MDDGRYFAEASMTGTADGNWLVREKIEILNEPVRILTLFADLSEDRAKEIAGVLNAD